MTIQQWVQHDPRLALAWHRVSGKGADRVLTVTDVMANGVVAYRDGLGRVGHLTKAEFDVQSVPLTSSEAKAALPALARELAFLRFPGLAQKVDRPAVKPVRARAFYRAEKRHNHVRGSVTTHVVVKKKPVLPAR